MINLQVYFVDTFIAATPGSGNPAVVCVVGEDQRISHESMAYISKYFSQIECVFAKRVSPGVWDLRWYTPDGNAIAPGGNSTIAVAFLLLNELDPRDDISMRTNVPGLTARCYHNKLAPEFVSVVLPSVTPRQIRPEGRNKLIDAFGGLIPSSFLAGEQDLIAVLEEESQVRNLRPNYDLLFDIQYKAFIVTAKGDRGGFVVRTFLTGQGSERWECQASARALMNLASYWYNILKGINALRVTYLSERGGEAWCRLDADNSEGASVIVSARCKKSAGPFKAIFEPMGDEDLMDEAPSPYSQSL